MAKSTKDKLIEEGFSVGASEIAEIIEESNGGISHEDLKAEVESRADLDEELTDELLSKLEEKGKLRKVFELTD